MDGLVTGWGATKSGGSTANVLQEVIVPIMSNEECKKTAYGEKRILPNMLCAGHPEGGKDSCQVRVNSVSLHNCRFSVENLSIRAVQM